MLIRLLAVGAGGVPGSVLRYLAGLAAHRLPGGGHFPRGTLIVNVLGCFAIGVPGVIVEARGAFSSELRLFLFVGLLGGFTTFSSFGYETAQLLRSEGGALALFNVGLHLALGLVAVWMGLLVVRPGP